MAKDYLSQQYRLYSATCGDDGTTPPVGNSPSSLFCGVYYYGNPMKSLSPYVLNKTDGGDYQLDNWMGGNTVTFTAGSKTLSPLSSTVWITEWPWTTKVKFFNYPGCQALPMQLTDGVWYYIVNNDPNTGAFQVATSPGSGTASGLNNASNSALGPFTTSGGASYSGDVCNVMLRVDASVAAVSPTAGLNTAFLDNGYATFSLAGITGLIVANQSLGNLFPSALYLRNNMLARWNNNTRGWTVMNSVGGDDIANVLWDPTIVLQ
jgi:hypothetical protein